MFLYFKGAPSLNVVTDHKPLKGIFKIALFDIGNPRLHRIREKLLEYDFTITLVPGKSHLIADGLCPVLLCLPLRKLKTLPLTQHVCV